jgi:hypothetical protein
MQLASGVRDPNRRGQRPMRSPCIALHDYRSTESAPHNPLYGIRFTLRPRHWNGRRTSVALFRRAEVTWSRAVRSVTRSAASPPEEIVSVIDQFRPILRWHTLQWMSQS